MFRQSRPGLPPPLVHPVDGLVRRRCLLALKPDGNRAIEGVLMQVVLDGLSPGYWIRGSVVAEAWLHEVNDHGQAVREKLEGDIWVDRGDVLYVNHLPDGS